MAQKVKKITLDIISTYINDWAVPIELRYNDEKFEIKDPVHSTKLFDGAIRWRCKVDGRDIEIFNQEDRWWMVQ